jgi:hypothetical protein
VWKEPLETGSQISELFESGSGSAKIFLIGGEAKKLMQIIIFFKFFLIIDNEKAIKQNKLYKTFKLYIYY